MIASSQLRSSVILPHFNRSELLRNTLAALRHQTIATNEFEIILVDDGSEDDSIKVAESLGLENLTILATSNHGPAAARNTGASHSSGRLLIFLDSDFVVRQNFVETHTSRNVGPGEILSGMGHWHFIASVVTEKMVSRFRNLGDLVLEVGQKLPVMEDEELKLLTESHIASQSFDQFLFRPLWLDDWGYEKIVEEFGCDMLNFRFPWLACCAGNFSINSDLFKDLGGFDEALRCYEDWEFGYRHILNNGSIRFDIDSEGFQQLSRRDPDRTANEDTGYRRFIAKHQDPDIALLQLKKLRGISFADLSEMSDKFDKHQESGQGKSALNRLIEFSIKNESHEAAHDLLIALEEEPFENEEVMMKLVTSLKSEYEIN